MREPREKKNSGHLDFAISLLYVLVKVILYRCAKILPMALRPELKGKKIELAECEKIYPNIYNRNLPAEIWCDDTGNEEHCMQAFRRFCPQHFVIDEVIFLKSRTWPVCQFRVDYKAENGDLPAEEDALKTLVKLISDKSASNCFIIDEFLIEKERVVMQYGLLKCECTPPVFEIADVKDLRIC